MQLRSFGVVTLVRGLESKTAGSRIGGHTVSRLSQVRDPLSAKVHSHPLHPSEMHLRCFIHLKSNFSGYALGCILQAETQGKP